MIAVGKYASFSSRCVLFDAEQGIDLLRSGDLESLHSSRERDAILSFYQQVYMRPLNAEVEDAEVVPLRGRRRRSTKRMIDMPATKIAHVVHGSQHDVHGIARSMHRSLFMWLTRAHLQCGTARAWPLAATRFARREERQLPRN